MEITRIILGQVVTEKAERQKAQPRKTYTLLVSQSSTKIDVRNALEKFYDVKVDSVRVQLIRPKTRPF